MAPKAFSWLKRQIPGTSSLEAQRVRQCLVEWAYYVLAKAQVLLKKLAVSAFLSQRFVHLIVLFNLASLTLQ